jgi:PAS domain S-box-containing protein
MPDIAVKSAGQTDAEADVDAFRRDRGPFVVAAEATRMPMVFTDAKSPGQSIVFVNDAFLAMTGYDRAEVLGQDFSFLLARGDNEKVLAQLEAAFASLGETPLEIEDRRKDGSVFWTAAVIIPVPDATGEVVQNLASFVNLTPHKKESERLRVLLDELNHRTQNTLATVQAIALRTLRDKAPREVIDTFEARVLALAKTHALLGHENWEALSLRDVLGQVLQPYGLREHKVARFTVEGEAVRLLPKAALTFAMAFHELATNAVRCGAFSQEPAGHVDIAWRVEPTAQGDRLAVSWRESGGPPVFAPTRKGFGSRLIVEGLARELEAEVRLDYPPTGLICEMAIPLHACSPAPHD